MVLPLSAETWFVRRDAGTRYSARVRSGQCDGRADAPYPGKGVNQHWAFSSAQYLYLEGTYGISKWVIAGGDTVVIRGCAALPGEQNPAPPDCRIGYGNAVNKSGLNCAKPNACSSTKFIFRNNIVLGFLDPRYSTGEVPGLFYLSDRSVKISTDHDLFFDLRSKPCPNFGSTSLI